MKLSNLRGFASFRMKRKFCEYLEKFSPWNADDQILIQISAVFMEIRYSFSLPNAQFHVSSNNNQNQNISATRKGKHQKLFQSHFNDLRDFESVESFSMPNIFRPTRFPIDFHARENVFDERKRIAKLKHLYGNFLIQMGDFFAFPSSKSFFFLPFFR